MQLKAWLKKLLSFNPRTREGANFTCFITLNDTSVSIHAPVKVRTNLLKLQQDASSFNPRTREGANVAFLNIAPALLVSIHAPVKVRTFQTDGVPLRLTVSIHAPVKVRTSL